MQDVQQLSILPAAEGLGRSSMGGSHEATEEQEGIETDMTPLHDANTTEASLSSPSSTRACKVEKRARKAAPLPTSPFLQPLPTIETLMTYPTLSRPVYDSLVRGDPPAQTYRTVIHTPKPPNMRVLDQNLIRAAEIQAFRRRKRANSGARSRSSSGSSTASSVSTPGYDDGTSSVISERSEGSSVSDVSEPTSPSSGASIASISSTSKATAGSPLATSQRYALFPSFTPEPLLAPIALTPSISAVSSGTSTPSPTLSFHSTRSSLSNSSSDSVNTSSSSLDVEAHSSSSSTTRSSAPSPASSAYPSPPTSPSPQSSRRSSDSGQEYMMYPSPPASPASRNAQNHHCSYREHRAFTFPPPCDVPTATIATDSTSTPSLHRAKSLPRSSDLPLRNFDDSKQWDLGEQTLGGGGLFDHRHGSSDMEWSMNGGELVFAVEPSEDEVVYGSAGMAVSPRLMRGCDSKGGLGLWVIEEEEECL